MALTKKKKKAVLDKDKIMVRIMLKDSMLIDPSLNEFNEMILYAEKHIEDLYDVHDGEVLNQNPNDWNEDYLNEQKGNVVTNFSKERIELLRRIVIKLYASDNQTKVKANEKYGNKNTEHKHRQHSRKSKRSLGLGLTVAGGVAAVAGVCLSKMVLTVTGGVVAAVGISMVMKDGKD